MSSASLKNDCCRSYLPMFPKCCVVVASYVIYVLWHYNIQYMVNDDIGILSLMQSGHPVPFIHCALFLSLGWLYSLAPDIPWYGAALISVQSVCMTIGLSCLLRWFGRGVVCLFVAVVYLYANLFFIQYVTYTVASILLAGHALVLMLSMLAGRRLDSRITALAGFLLVLSIIFRLRGIAAVGIAAFPVIVFMYRKILIEQGTCFALAATRHFIVLGCVVLLVLLGDFAYKAYGMDEVDKNYARYFALRGKIHGYPWILNKKIPKEELQAATGWSAADRLRFHKWMFFDEDVYNYEALEKYLALVGEQILPSFHELDNLDIKKLQEQHLASAILPIFLFLLSVQFVNKRNVMGLAMYAGYLACYALFMIHYMRFPLRVGAPILLCAFLYAGLLCSRDLKDCLQSQERPAGMITVGILALAAIYGLHTWNTHERKVRDEGLGAYLEQVRFVESQKSGAIVFVQPGKSKLQHTDPLKPLKIGSFEIMTGWLTFSPLFYEQISVLGIHAGRDLIGALAGNNNAYIVAQEKWITLLLGYAKDRGQNLRAEQIELLPQSKLVVYALHKK